MENDIEKLKNFLIENPNFILNDIDILIMNPIIIFTNVGMFVNLFLISMLFTS